MRDNLKLGGGMVNNFIGVFKNSKESRYSVYLLLLMLMIDIPIYYYFVGVSSLMKTHGLDLFITNDFFRFMFPASSYFLMIQFVLTILLIAGIFYDLKSGRYINKKP
ncbi:hypothetical protein EXT68_03735 [Pectobacterium parmentieri]|uniref:Uncharacterized protein n=3 Tax=Pectobacterium parmentieri TaxID=1905730 RepID=A0ABS0RUN7_PECPM|nr:hypothetical protein [Pectobacterium parmentieri]MBI0469328.1 hypothetical protein [Pectobacterium parmentieri]MBI0491952.1 hypothetical protein [Pectobacterium parmentieri]MBI0553236.1 hypothetical protein [Pectobacterium parmentieri]MBI0566367.1 hypothetical protein [Pectobacterium parmentieri]MBI0571063.1 hypothetical protein [Pectobacterium parmentieri]